MGKLGREGVKRRTGDSSKKKKTSAIKRERVKNKTKKTNLPIMFFFKALLTALR